MGRTGHSPHRGDSRPGADPASPGSSRTGWCLFARDSSSSGDGPFHQGQANNSLPDAAGPVSQCGWQPAQASLGGHCRHHAQLPAALPGQQPCGTLVLVPPPAAAAGRTPSNLAHKTSPGEGSSPSGDLASPSTHGFPPPQPPPLQTRPPLSLMLVESAPQILCFSPKSSPQGVTALAEPKPTLRVAWSRRRSVQSPHLARSPVSPCQPDARSALHPWGSWFAPDHICSVDSLP